MSLESTAKPALLLIDLTGRETERLRPVLEDAGVGVWPVNTLDEVSTRVAAVNPSVVALCDDGSDLGDALALMARLKGSHPYRRSIVFSDRQDADFLADCLGAHQIDQVIAQSAPGEAMAAQVASAVRTASLLSELVATNHQLSRSSKTDSLTGLYNHGHILEWLRIEHKRASRDLEPLCCVMVDLDHFKFINDTYGHRFGDFVLKGVAALLEGSVRESDIVGRYGGEEFLILAPKTNTHGGLVLAEKLRTLMEGHSFQDQVFDVRLTASFGVATTDHAGANTPEGLLQLADRSLFEAKEGGRNRIVVAQSESGGFASTVHAEIDATQAARGQGTPTVLIMDDSPLMVEMLSSIVRSMGLRVIEAYDGQEALERLKATPPDLVLLDVNVPGADGFQICRQIRTIYRDSHVPVIFVTSDKGLDSQLQGYESGADDYITKPVVREHLIAKIHAQLRVKTLHDRLQTANAKLKQAQQTAMRSERLKAIGQLAGGVAHDFNNVLSSILGHAQVLLAKSPPAEIEHGLRAIESIVDEGADTIRRLLFFTQPAPGGEGIGEIDIAELLEDCLNLTRARWKDQADKQGVHCHIERQLEPGLTLRAVAVDLREVFTALILNAVDAMPQGGTLTLSAQRRGDREILVEVQDTGVGIAPDVQRQIFDPFFTTKPESGAGLGLSVAHGIVTRMRGRIEVVSKVGAGSTFRVALPLPAAPVTAVTPVPRANDRQRQPSVLVIDDEPHIREVFSEILADQSYEVVTAADGEAGLAHLQARDFDVVITDLGIPGISGWEVARQVKKMRPDVKVVLTSGWGNDLDSETVDRTHIDAVLPKPVSLRALLDCVSAMVQSPAAAAAE